MTRISARGLGEKGLKKSEGFTLIELLVVIGIIVVLGFVAVILIRPDEQLKKGRDATRIADIAKLVSAINLVATEATGSNVLCNGANPPCSGASNTGTRAVNGTGWVPVNMSNQSSISITTLPVDPVNTSPYVYTYQTNSDGSAYEINAVLESDQYSARMNQDGGNNDSAFESGTSLVVIN